MADQDIISVRGLVDSEAKTPLREFYGVLKEYYPDQQFNKTRVVLNFAELEVLESVEPYNFPTATITIPLSNRKNSGWGIFGESLATVIPDDQDIKDCIDKKMRLKMEVGHVYGHNTTTDEDMTGNPWRVVEVAGVVAGASTTSAKDKAMELLDGKIRADFNKLAYADPIIRQDAKFQRAITDKSFISGVVAVGLFNEDEEGVFHKVEPAS